ncbi:hypothetical protein ACLB2K_067126 [Fragaria x ananassa]
MEGHADSLGREGRGVRCRTGTQTPLEEKGAQERQEAKKKKKERQMAKKKERQRAKKKGRQREEGEA